MKCSRRASPHRRDIRLFFKAAVIDATVPMTSHTGAWRFRARNAAYAFTGELASARPDHAEQRKSVHDCNREGLGTEFFLKGFLASIGTSAAVRLVFCQPRQSTQSDPFFPDSTASVSVRLRSTQGLLFRKFRFFQQQCFHIRDHQSRIERAGNCRCSECGLYDRSRKRARYGKADPGDQPHFVACPRPDRRHPEFFVTQLADLAVAKRHSHPGFPSRTTF